MASQPTNGTMNERIFSVNEVVTLLSELSGSTITVEGVLRVQREHHAICNLPELPGKQTAQLWVYFHHASLGTKDKNISRLNGSHVLATGTLDISRKGHLRGFPGSFTIKKIQLLGQE